MLICKAICGNVINDRRHQAATTVDAWLLLAADVEVTSTLSISTLFCQAVPRRPVLAHLSCICRQGWSLSPSAGSSDAAVAVLAGLFLQAAAAACLAALCTCPADPK
jgi:hypothetical protein